MSEIYLVRHGETDWNKHRLCQGRIDNPLDDKGMEEAKTLGKKFKEENMSFDLFVASPLLRAQETLKIIMHEMNISAPIITDSSFLERDFGELEGKTVAEADKIISTNQTDQVKGFEKNTIIQERVYRGIIKLAAKYPDKKILIISHSHAIKSLLIKINPQKYNYLTYLPNLNVTVIKTNDKLIDIDCFSLLKN